MAPPTIEWIAFILTSEYEVAALLPGSERMFPPSWLLSREEKPAMRLPVLRLSGTLAAAAYIEDARHGGADGRVDGRCGAARSRNHWRQRRRAG